MAKYRVEYENREIKHVLTFRGKEFDYTMKESELGMSSDKSVFSFQLPKTFSDLSEDELENDVDIDMLSCYLDDEEELFEILGRLEELEQQN